MAPHKRARPNASHDSRSEGRAGDEREEEGFEFNASLGASAETGGHAPPPASQEEHEHQMEEAAAEEECGASHVPAAEAMLARDAPLVASRDQLLRDVDQLEEQWLSIATNSIRACTQGYRNSIGDYFEYHLSIRRQAAPDLDRAVKVQELMARTRG